MQVGKKRKKKDSIARSVLETGLFILAVLVITLILSRYVFSRVTVHNHSMEQTLLENDNLLIDKISYRFHEPKRFDIIVFKQKGTGEDLIKRIIGLPFETVQITDGKIYIDGEVLTDVKGVDKPEFAGIAADPVTLSVGEYFVIGDNREESIDSRYEEVGIVTSTKITGRLFARIYPFKRIRLF